MINLALVPLLTSALLSSFPMQGSSQDLLGQIRAIYDAVDSNKDGKVAITEATAAGVSAEDFASQDTNRSASLEPDEFVVYYRQLLVRAGSKVPAALDAEIKRAAVARAAAEKAAAEQAAAEKVAAEKAAAMRAEAERIEAGRIARERAAAEKAAAGDLAEAEAKAQQAKKQPPIPSDRPGVEPKEQGGTVAKEAAPGPEGPASNPPVEKGASAEALTEIVQRLADSGKLNAPESHAMFTILQDFDQFAGKPNRLMAIPKVVRKIQPRIGALVQEGKLSGPEARLLSSAFKERAEMATSALASLNNPEVPEPVLEEAPAAEAQVGNAPLDSSPETEAGNSPSQQVPLSPRDARLLIQRLMKDGSIPAEEGRKMTQAAGILPKASVDVDLLSEARRMIFDASARVEILAQTGKLSKEEGLALGDMYQRREMQATRALKAAGAPIDVVNTTQADPAAGAQRHVRRLINEGRVSASEGRLMFQAMADTSTMAGDLAQLRSMRDALGAVRPRIGQLVRQGHMTSDEGRELSSVFDARATSAAAALAAMESKESRTGVGDFEADDASRPAPRKGAKGTPERGKGRKGNAANRDEKAKQPQTRAKRDGEANQSRRPQRKITPKPKAKDPTGGGSRRNYPG